MSLTHSNIDWYNIIYDGFNIIDSCGNFPNVPLIGTKGGINYYPSLARRQLGYPMKDVPHNIHLEGLFFKEGENDRALKEEIVHVWRHTHKKGRESLGRPNCVAIEPYLRWVQTRAIKLRMPYPRQEVLPLKEPVLYFMKDKEKLQIAFNKVQQEKNSWRNKYRILSVENAKI